MVFGGAGLVLYAWEYVSGATADMQMVLVSVSLTATIAVALYRYGFFGGADAKALVAISVILPVYNPLMSFYVHPITGITVLTNAVLFALVVPLYNALSNLVKVARGEQIFEGLEEPAWRKVLACFVGTPSKRPIRYHSVIECSAGEGKKRFSFRLNCGDDSYSIGSCCAGSSAGGRIWLSQNLPFLVFILAGFLVTILFGDMLLQLLRR
jgi:preflagellin peptidase FlaK